MLGTKIIIGTQNATPVRAFSAHKETKAYRSENDLLKVTEWVNGEKERAETLKTRRSVQIQGCYEALGKLPNLSQSIFVGLL